MIRVSSRNPIPLIIVFMVIAASSVVFTTQSNYDQPQLSANFGTPEATTGTSTGPKFGQGVFSQITLTGRPV